ncbi:CRISPR-associated helicase Cas3' [Massilicoli timonensis]|uniref:CRISPR-associated helicase Cas3 n=1 Tax=Massilicoli timonensis TaxID=2015901 RepID=A0ABT1SIV4_9FIRM|nr:CRISPR-associated helicase Cas3' [Massilicoli timonensis]MCQ5121157.1 CRISPR-associated helicase Cas3' [Massilicoli timonensis]
MDLNELFLSEDKYIAHVNYTEKRTQTVYEHLKNVASLALLKCPLIELKNLIMLIALLHDAGKLSNDFRKYMEGIFENGEKSKQRMVNHSTAGGRIIERINADQKYVEMQALNQMISYAVYSHHGLNDCIDENGNTLFEKRREAKIDIESIEKVFFDIVDKEALRHSVEEAREDFSKICINIGKYIQGIVKKEVSEENFEKEVERKNHFIIGMYERVLLSLLIDSDWADTSSFMNDTVLPDKTSKRDIIEIWNKSMENLNTYLSMLSIEKGEGILNKCRKEISDRCYEEANKNHNLYRLTIPTGSGKTLCSLRFGLRHAQEFKKEHIYYVAPFTSILDQNAEEIRKAVGVKDYVLEHHCNVVIEKRIDGKTDDEKVTEYQRLIETWDSPIIATTAVQMLNTLYSSKKSCIRRMHNLCNSVIIFDEVQALPINQLEIFNLAVIFLTEFCNTTVVLCSATQPSLVNLPYNNLWNVKDLLDNQNQNNGQKQAVLPYAEVFKRTEIVIDESCKNSSDMGLEKKEFSRFIGDKTEKYTSVLVIVNTKSAARKIYEQLSEDYADRYEIYHLSTNMCPKNRKEVLEKLKISLEHIRKNDDHKEIICVSTQLIEAGVDLSFACVIRSIAGLDNIIQAAGRCNRHKEQELGKVFVVQLERNLENLENLREIRMAQKAIYTVLNRDIEFDIERFNNALNSEEAHTIIKKYYEEYLKIGNYVEKDRRTRYKVNIDKYLDELLSFDEAYIENELPFLSQAFKRAGDNYSLIADDGKIDVVIPYDDVCIEVISTLEKKNYSISEKRSNMQKLQQYTVRVSQHYVDRLSKAIRRIGESEILVLSKDFYDENVGILEECKLEFLEQ